MLIRSYSLCRYQNGKRKRIILMWRILILTLWLLSKRNSSFSLDSQGQCWKVNTNYKIIKHFLLIYHLFNALNSGSKVSSIVRFDPIQNIWTKLGDVQKGRFAHGVIQVESEFIVSGGDGTFPTESCKLKNDSMTCIKRKPTLSDFAEGVLQRHDR